MENISSDRQEHYDGMNSIYSYRVYTLAIDIIIMLPTIVGNMLIIISVWKFKRLRTHMNILVANLAVSDLLVGIVYIPVELVLLFVKSFSESKYICLSWHAFGVGFCLASIINLFLISLDRYAAIVHPFFHVRNSKTIKNLVLMICLSWILALSTGFMPMMGVNKWQPGLPCDSHFFYYNPYISFVYILVLFFVVINFLMYIKVITIATRTMKKLEIKGVESHETMRRLKSCRDNFRKTKIMFLVFGVFAICWGPFCIAIVLDLFYTSETKSVKVAKKFLAYLGVMNSGLNWLIYGFKNKHFNKAFKALLTCAKRPQQVIFQGGTSSMPASDTESQIESLSYGNYRTSENNHK